MDLADIRSLKKNLRENDFLPQKRFSQNFLINKNILNKIIQFIDINSNDYILEIGPGIGTLTVELAKRAKKVLAIEIDKNIIEPLQKNIKNFQNIELLNLDILKVKNEDFVKKLGSGEYILTSNLPYNITSLVIRKFLSEKPKPQKMILMVQKEVGQRICAKAGDHSLLSLSVQIYSRPKILLNIPAKSFYPAPKVASCLLLLDNIQDKIKYKDKSIDEKEFFNFLHISFSAKRKQLQNNLSKGLKIDKAEIKKILSSLGLTENIRAQELTLEKWYEFFLKIKGKT